MKRIPPLTVSFVSILFSANAQNDSLERAIQYGYYTDYSCAIKEFPSQDSYIDYNSSDSLGASEPAYITKINEDGTTQWYRGAFDSIYESGNVNKLLQAYDQNIVLSGYEQVCDMPIGNGSNYIILGYYSGRLIIDTAGNVLDSPPLPKAVGFLGSYRDSLYFAIEGRALYKADSLFTLAGLDSSFYSTPEVNALVVFNNRLWILHHQFGSNFSKLVKGDFNFGNIGQQVFSYFNGSDFDARDLLVNYHSFELFVQERTNKLNSHILLKNWINATDSTYYYNTDVGVTGFYANSYNSYGTVSHIGGTTFVYPTFDMYVNVKNYGQVPVKNCNDE